MDIRPIRLLAKDTHLLTNMDTKLYYINRPLPTMDDQSYGTGLSQETILKIRELKRLVYKYPQYCPNADEIIRWAFHSSPQQSFFSTPYYRPEEEPQTRYRPVQASTFPCGFWGSRGAEIVKSIHEQQEARHTMVSMKSRRMYLAVQKQLDRDTRKRHLCGYLNLEYLCRGVFYLLAFLCQSPQ